jgi:hypothetical protein
MTEDQQVALASFQKRFSHLKDERDKKYCDIPCLIRYLIARDWDLNKAEDMLNESLQWRRDFKPHEITPESIAEEAQTGKIYINGTDKLGRPIIIMRPERENTSNTQNQLKLLVYTLETAVSTMGEGVSQLVWVIGFANFSMSSMPSISQTMETIKILSNHYPERLGLAVMLDTPWLFGFFWRSVSGFINQKTASKVLMITSSTHKDEKDKTLKRHFDLKNFEKDLGGELEFAYDPKKYFASLEPKEKEVITLVK